MYDNFLEKSPHKDKMQVVITWSEKIEFDLDWIRFRHSALSDE